MKNIKALILVLLVVNFSTPVYAGTTTETVAGAAIGGLLGGTACRNCSSRTRNIAAGVSALAGGLVGNSMGDRQDRREALVQQHVDNETYAVTNGVAYTTPRPQQFVEPIRRADIPSAYRQMQYVQQSNNDGCDEQYYRGNYNPQAAHAYCEGRRERERQVREAYNAGLSGN